MNPSAVFWVFVAGLGIYLFFSGHYKAVAAVFNVTATGGGNPVTKGQSMKSPKVS